MMYFFAKVALEDLNEAGVYYGRKAITRIFARVRPCLSSCRIPQMRILIPGSQV